ncbi:MAG: gamma-butyrobetaine hydroxylase-like domain-containing protein [Pseudomonadota bacterium]
MSTDAERRAWPTRLVFQKARACLAAEFDDGASGEVSFADLRLNSPSADVRGHGAGPPPPPPPIPSDLQIISADPVGRYAVRLHFSDGHSSGLYTWSLLYRLTVGDPARPEPAP